LMAATPPNEIRELALLSEHFGALVNNNAQSDVTFMVGVEDEEPQPIYAHRLILACRSPVLASMLLGSLKESQEREIPIGNIRHDIFKLMMQYIYTGAVSVTAETVVPLLASADQYQLLQLKSKCFNYMEKFLTKNTVCTLLQTAMMYGNHDFASKCKMFISCHTRDVINSDDFLTLSQQSLREMLMTDQLDVEELELYKALLRWGEKNLEKNNNSTSLKETLLPLIPFIRFPLILPDDLMNIVKPSGVVPLEVYVQAIEYHLCPDNVDTSGTMFKPRVPAPVFTWQGNSKEFQFTEGGLNAKRIGSNYWTKVFGSHGFSSGKAFWEVKIVNINGNDKSGLIIGVTSCKERSAYCKDLGIGMAGHCYRLSSELKAVPIEVSTGFKIGIQLDLVKLKASFFVNGIALSMQGELEKGLTYWPVVHMHYKDDAIALVEVQ